MERLSQEYEVPVYVVDVNRYTAVWREYDVRATPTVVRFEAGREHLRIQGEQAEETWRRLLELHQERFGG